MPFVVPKSGGSVLPIKQLSPRTINLSVSSALYRSEVSLQISILCFPVAVPIFSC